MTLDQPTTPDTRPMMDHSVPNPASTSNEDEGLGIDRAFIMQMAQIPFIALLFVVLARISHLLWAALAPETSTLPNLGPMVLLSALMVLAAIIDGWAFKVPNWLTLSTVVSGWIIGMIHTLQYSFDSGIGGVGSALFGTAVGFALIFGALFVEGMGQGDVKMQMGFGSWIGAYYGQAGMWYIVYAFCAGVIVGGIFGLVIIILRANYRESGRMFAKIFSDFRNMLSGKVSETQKRAHARRPDWIRLPYGVPLSVGFVGFLIYKYTFGI